MANHLLNRQLRKIFVRETKLQESVRSQMSNFSNDSFSEYLELMGNIQRTLERHVTTLEAHFLLMGLEKSAIFKETIALLFAMSKVRVSQLFYSQASKVLRRNYARLGSILMDYATLHTIALGYKNQAAAELALSHFHDWNSLLREIEKVFPLIVASELESEEDLINLGAGQQAIHNIHQFWRKKILVEGRPLPES